MQIISHQFSSNFSSYLRVKIPGCAIRIIEALPPEQQRYAIDKASLAGLQFYRYYIEVSIEVAKRALFEIQKSSHLQPLAATRVAASGRKWPQVAASGRKWPQVAAKWPLVADLATISRAASLAATRVAASGRKWQPLAASGRKWPLGQVAASGKWLQVAASGRKWPQVAARASGYW